MRKSLLKTPPSALSSRVAHPPAALVAVGERRRAPKRNGSAPYTGVPRVRVAVEEAPGGEDVAKLRLVEGFVSRTELADCTQFALQWLGESLGVSQTLCVVRPGGEASLFAVGAYGLPGSATNYTISLEDWNNPLVPALINHKQMFFPAPH